MEAPYTVESINNKIKELVCHETILNMKDDMLMESFKNSKSYLNNVKLLKTILCDSEGLETVEAKHDYIIQRMSKLLIPAGTKGAIRGKKFNDLVMDKINKLNLDTTRFSVKFEKQHPLCNTSEIPDFYIHEIDTNKLIIGMNQVDLWSGGQQTNRGSKYIIDNKLNTENTKVLCVICNEITIKTMKAKPFKIFNKGLTNKTLCYMSNLHESITSFFD